MTDSPFKPSFFEREDESPDDLFYREPRLLVHIDDSAIARARSIYEELLPKHAALLDLMSSFRSHMPPELQWTRLAGVGMNEVELRENDQLTEYALRDLNAEPIVPYGDAEFDGAVVTVSVQYLTQPVAVFREVARVLRPKAPFVVTYSNRMFPTKAVRIWRAIDDRDRAALIGAYFKYSASFEAAQTRTCSPAGPDRHDPLFAVWALRREP